MTIALCIIDMQYIYTASRHCADQVIHEIELARRRKAPIICVTVAGEGRTLRKVRNALKGYSRVIDVRKHSTDGSEEILRALEKRKVAFEHIRVCGVNRCACVRATAENLSRLGVKVHISFHATSCDYLPCEFNSSAMKKQGLGVRYQK